MKANPWITYRTRFLVKAKQLTTTLTFTDVLGRQHSGRKGDYLVESSDGVLRIAPRQIFEDIYVPLFADSKPADTKCADSEKIPAQPTIPPYQKAWRPNGSHRPDRTGGPLSLPPHLTRKSPQPDLGRRNSLPGLGSL